MNTKSITNLSHKTNDTRQHILNVGYELIVAKGFTSVGLSELLKVADVPKGSFYHYFKSKEEFGEALIKSYFAQYIEKVTALFIHGDNTGYERVIHYFELWTQEENGQCNANKCLVVKLSAEVADLSDSMRNVLAEGAAQIIQVIQSGIEIGIRDGSINVSDAHQTAQQLYQQWIGASLLNKLYQDRASLKLCLATTRTLLKPQHD
ncbi:TetR/AcrR family transcriptional regulator [Vibrio sinensis]|uniref:TetR/AcrR family transcriptional regulator n=1 Tax=Vibrio sinensis TaxID=2302434 RepID=A0A3A6QG13_9VIBR|nr:TetR/AcrR family transcriptional regulator [Vibrio sinensis]RJX64852.1 TetR/AcrR family transcriptional regulator [Vibrio sinensis]